MAAPVTWESPQKDHAILMWTHIYAEARRVLVLLFISHVVMEQQARTLLWI
jgi:hypothetical protein